MQTTLTPPATGTYAGVTVFQAHGNSAGAQISADLFLLGVTGVHPTAGLTTGEPNLTRYDLFNADECFLTGTGAEIIPVVKIDGREIGNGKPGSVTLKLISGYRALTNGSGEPIYR